MKNFLLSLSVAALVFGSVVGVRSQSPAPAAFPHKARLQEIKARNEATLNSQKATLQKLDELQKNAEQMKIFARRS